MVDSCKRHVIFGDFCFSRIFLICDEVDKSKAARTARTPTRTSCLLSWSCVRLCLVLRVRDVCLRPRARRRSSAGGATMRLGLVLHTSQYLVRGRCGCTSFGCSSCCAITCSTRWLGAVLVMICILVVVVFMLLRSVAFYASQKFLYHRTIKIPAQE